MPTLLKLQPRLRRDAGRRTAPSAALGGTADRIVVARPRPDRRARRRRAPAWSGPPSRKASRSPASTPYARRAASAHRSSRSPTSASPSRTVRRTRSSSSRGSTPARRSPARRSRSSALDNQVVLDAARPAPMASRSRRDTPLRDADNWWKFAFVVTAEKDGDIAYVGSDWNEGIQPWDFGDRFNLNEASAAAARHGVQRSRRVPARRGGARSRRSSGTTPPTASGCCPPARRSSSRVRDSQNRVVDERTVKVNAWSSAEWTLTLPADGALGNYIGARDSRERPAEAAHGRAADAWRDAGPPTPTTTCRTTRSVQRLVPGRGVPPARLPRRRRADRRAADRRRRAEGRRHRALPVRRADGRASGDVDVHEVAARRRAAGGHEKFPDDRWLFVGWSDDERPAPDSGQVKREETKLTATRRAAAARSTRRRDAGVPYTYTLEGDVEDVSRQHIANRASVTVHPGALVHRRATGRRTSSSRRAGLKTEIVPSRPTARSAAGVPVTSR